MAYAVVFPGQGSQYVPMLAALGAVYPQVAQTFAQASEVLGYDLWQLAQTDQDAISKTAVTQPLMLTAGVATWRVWQQQYPTLPLAVAGHSLGEYTAMVAAQMLGFSQAVEIVKRRGELMQSTAGENTQMAAVLGLDAETVINCCKKYSQKSQIVEAVNFNAPGQVVIGGHKSQLEKVAAELKRLGARRVQPLLVSVAAHSSLMRPIAAEFEQVLAAATLLPPAVPIIQNFNAKCIKNAKKEPNQPKCMQSYQKSKFIKNSLRQLYKPVLWVDSMRNLQQYAQHSNLELKAIIELGGKSVLASLNKRILKPNAPHCLAADCPNTIEQALKLVGGE